jgi:hypothetical protein
VGHSYDYIRSLSITRVSPLLKRRGYYSLKSPRTVPYRHEDAWYYLLEAPGATFRGITINQCYNLHLFGVDEKPIFTYNLTLGHSTHVLCPTVLDPTKIDAHTLKPSTQKLLGTAPLSSKESGRVDRSTINGLDWLAQHLDPSLAPSSASHRGPTSLTSSYSTALKPVFARSRRSNLASEAGKDEQEYIDAKELYQDIFQALFDCHHPGLDPKVEFSFTHWHYQPDCEVPIGRLSKSKVSGWSDTMTLVKG